MYHLKVYSFCLEHFSIWRIFFNEMQHVCICNLTELTIGVHLFFPVAEENT
jgi:hypothetical protein